MLDSARVTFAPSVLRSGAHGGSRTHTGDALDVVPLLLGYVSEMELATLAGFEPCVVRLKGGCPVQLDDRVVS